MPINRGPFNALIDDNGSGLTGSVWNKAAIQNVLLDPIDANYGPIPYAPLWTTTGANLGNGTYTGTYTQVGKQVSARLVLTIGSTTNMGTAGAFLTFTLPADAVPYSTAGLVRITKANGLFYALILDAGILGLAANGFGLATLGSAPSTAAAAYTTNGPFPTWAAGDVVVMFPTFQTP